MPLPVEARAGLERAWLEILRTRHPAYSWAMVGGMNETPTPEPEPSEPTPGEPEPEPSDPEPSDPE